jgi:hypothetical protein
MLGFMLAISIGIAQKAFTAALAFIANRFAVFFDDVPLTVADSTNHVSLPKSTMHAAI